MIKNAIFIFIGLMMTLSSCKKENTIAANGEAGPVGEEVQVKNEAPKLTDESEMTFDDENYDFKEIKKGETVTHIFKFTNTGKKPLVISEVRPSCGCTTPKYTTGPVAPGKKGSITVTFDSSGFDGTVSKTVAVSGNFETKIIRFQAKIN